MTLIHPHHTHIPHRRSITSSASASVRSQQKHPPRTISPQPTHTRDGPQISTYTHNLHMPWDRSDFKLSHLLQWPWSIFFLLDCLSSRSVFSRRRGVVSCIFLLPFPPIRPLFAGISLRPTTFLSTTVIVSVRAQKTALYCVEKCIHCKQHLIVATTLQKSPRNVIRPQCPVPEINLAHGSSHTHSHVHSV